ncbi:MAG: DUF4149 domain-containing protein [Candidatus Thiodiazotropha sp. L084R]
MSIALTLHLLSVIIWVGGMFFAHVVLRPVLNKELEPHHRLPLLLKVFDGFFPWVWGVVVTNLASGYWMLFTQYENNTSFWLNIMTVIGTVMAAIFIFIYSIPYHQLETALKSDDMPRAVAAISLIRQFMLVNLVLGVFVTVVAMIGKYGFR